jgi:DNA-binding GntR family transcriptional regulator
MASPTLPNRSAHRAPNPTAPPKGALEHRTLSAAIAQQLRDRIVAGDFAAGTQLRQDSLATEFGVSRIPVREALFQLEAEGLVHMQPHKGAEVMGVDWDEVEDVFALRAMLEPRLLRAAIPRMGDAAWEQAYAMETLFDDAMARQDVAQWGKLNAEFHLSLYRPAGLPRSLSVVAGLLQSSDRYTRLQLRRQGAMQRAQHEHHGLLKLGKAGKVDKACAALVAHIESVYRDLKHQLGDAAG